MTSNSVASPSGVHDPAMVVFLARQGQMAFLLVVVGAEIDEVGDLLPVSFTHHHLGGRCHDDRVSPLAAIVSLDVVLEVISFGDSTPDTPP